MSPERRGHLGVATKKCLPTVSGVESGGFSVDFFFKGKKTFGGFPQPEPLGKNSLKTLVKNNNKMSNSIQINVS